jgi:hypothetical protein
VAINYFIGWTVKDLEAELRIAQEDLAAGKSVIQAGAGDASTQNRIEQSIQQRIEQLLAALNKLDPEKYPIDQISRITQTRVGFLCQR